MLLFIRYHLSLAILEYFYLLCPKVDGSQCLIRPNEVDLISFSLASCYICSGKVVQFVTSAIYREKGARNGKNRMQPLGKFCIYHFRALHYDNFYSEFIYKLEYLQCLM